MRKPTTLLWVVLGLLLTWAPLTAPVRAEGEGILEGQVVNGTAGGQDPSSGLTVLLHVYRGDLEEDTLETTTDAGGRFRFDGLDTDAFSARFAVIMNMVSQWTRELGEWGTFEDNMVAVKTSRVWLFMRLLTEQYYLGVAVSRKSSLKLIRPLIFKYSERLRNELSYMAAPLDHSDYDE